ncbi:hypothetical protein DZA65_02449 [Dickeya dianthicola]|uniref:DUF2732 domain-containing protein n=1 Tax=Dickeya dianthicola TaxID=204039 RepID=A0AAP2D1V4_9GAMM|nr:DUF2732 family protein [Dickeya dianthicola]AYC19336.1 hypothetical protein DZA65_02449 [Dickeya dianthicola]MBI0437750.1 DUF2732 family protein [Dickeya dianthicola]MBI0450787.1 DUF2732 family protein [Dickeya dianthicola]MBI0455320.1 DUF2732 family protein [Dickeya dianthicola]MBI0457570.1 DUF2732 family protein [Dickeya dianthicola]
MKNTPINHKTSPARRQISNDVWRTDFAHRYSEHLDQLAQHARQEQLSAQELVALLQQEAEKIRHQIWEAH